jgi:hypothetical protein
MKIWVKLWLAVFSVVVLLGAFNIVTNDIKISHKGKPYDHNRD